MSFRLEPDVVDILREDIRNKTEYVQNQIDHSEHGFITLVGYFGPISGLISRLKSD